MPEDYRAPVRIHRVTTRRRNLRAVQCPLEPELLVAEFAGELPPEVEQAVREHIAVCETCGERSRALRVPYELLGSLREQPVPYVPDLRDRIRTHLRSQRFYRGVVRAAGRLGRGSALGASGILGLGLIVVLIVVSLIVTSNAQAVGRSSNTLSNVPSAGRAGLVFAETDKLVTVTDSTGTSWQAAEVIAVSERSGAVVHSLPDSDADLQAAQPGQLPVAVAVAPNGATVYEVTAPNTRHQQALIAFDASSGAVRYINVLRYQDGRTLAAGNEADALAVAPNGTRLYVGLNVTRFAGAPARALAVDAATGRVLRTLPPAFTTSIPLPPPPGSLPISAFPGSSSTLYAAGYTATLGAGGNLVVSSDGNWLFDVILLSSQNTVHYAVVRRFSASTGGVQQELALQGNFTLAQLAINNVQPQTPAAATATPTPPAAVVPNPTAPQPQLYLIKGSPDAQCFVLDPGSTGPTLIGMIALGGPPAPAGGSYIGTLVASPSSDGTPCRRTASPGASRSSCAAARC
jgi:hypothetical protein